MRGPDLGARQLGPATPRNHPPPQDLAYNGWVSVTRRAFLQGGVLFLSGTATSNVWACLDQTKPLAKVGVLTDIHHADKVEAGVRFYRQALPKLREALRTQGRENLDRIVHLGDLVDAVKELDQEEAAIQAVTSEFRTFGKPYNFVTGNHCLSAVSKRRYRDLTGSSGHYEHFDVNGVRFLCLDTCYRADSVPYEAGNFDWKDAAVPYAETRWLKFMLRRAPGPCVVLCHHLLEPLAPYCVANHAEVRAAIAESGKVIAVLQGHHHQNRYTELDRIPYITLRSVVEGPEIGDRGSAVLSVFPDGSASLKGFSQQRSYSLGRVLELGVGC